MTGEDLGFKPSTIEETKFEYSPLGKIFNKGLSEDDKKGGLFKRLKNIKDTNLTQLQAIKDQGEKQLRELKNIDKSRTLKAISEIVRKNDEANKILLNVKKIDAKLDTAELVCTKSNNSISLIERESKDINNDLFKKYFDFSTPVALTKKYLK